MLPILLQQVRKCSIKKRISSSLGNTTFTSQRSNSYKKELQAMPALLFYFSPSLVRSYFLLVLYCTDKKTNLLPLSFSYKNKENSSATYWYNMKAYNTNWLTMCRTESGKYDLLSIREQNKFVH